MQVLLVLHRRHPPTHAHFSRPPSRIQDARIQMTLALKQQNVNTLTETLLRVSDPKHTDYGKHLTKGEVDSLVAPSDKTVRHAVPSFTRS
jgi:tripeptidyl-peptidase-1